MKKTFFHGTSADNLESILKYGLSCVESKVWACSEDRIYIYDIDRYCSEMMGIEKDDENYRFSDKYKLAFNAAADNAGCALAASKDCRLVVFEIELEEGEVESDNSCDNMEHAFCIGRDIRIEEIKSIRISNDLSLLKGYFIMLMLDREQSNLEFSDIERKVGELFQSGTICPEDIEQLINWETVGLPHLV